MRFHSPAEWDILLKYVPRHREVSSSGMLLHTYQAEKLREEGHRIVPYSRRNDSPKVENARNFWFDFDKEANVDPNIYAFEQCMVGRSSMKLQANFCYSFSEVFATTLTEERVADSVEESKTYFSQEKLIAEEVYNVPKEKVREICKENLVNIENGKRDFRF